MLQISHRDRDRRNQTVPGLVQPFDDEPKAIHDALMTYLTQVVILRGDIIAIVDA